MLKYYFHKMFMSAGINSSQLVSMHIEESKQNILHQAWFQHFRDGEACTVYKKFFKAEVIKTEL